MALAEKPEDAAKALRLKGNEQFDERRYAEALETYKRAYELSKDPALIYNMGRAYQFMNNAPEALEFYESFQAKASPELMAKVQGFDAVLAEARKKVSTLKLTVNASGARVLVRKKEIGTTPLKPTRLLAGEAEIEILSDTHETLQKKISLPGGESVSIDLTLVPKKKEASGPSDGPRKGAGEEAKPSRWWIWAGAGLVLAGGVALTVALLTERSPDQGSLGQISAPLLGRQGLPLLKF